MFEWAVIDLHWPILAPVRVQFVQAVWHLTRQITIFQSFQSFWPIYRYFGAPGQLIWLLQQRWVEMIDIDMQYKFAVCPLFEDGRINQGPEGALFWIIPHADLHADGFRKMFRHVLVNRRKTVKYGVKIFRYLPAKNRNFYESSTNYLLWVLISWYPPANICSENCCCMFSDFDPIFGRFGLNGEFDFFLLSDGGWGLRVHISDIRMHHPHADSACELAAPRVVTLCLNRTMHHIFLSMTKSTYH